MLKTDKISPVGLDDQKASAHSQTTQQVAPEASVCFVAPVLGTNSLFGLFSVQLWVLLLSLMISFHRLSLCLQL